MSYRHVLLLLLSVVALLSVNVTAVEFDQNKFDVYRGDVDNDGDQDIYLKGKQQVILLHGDIITPIVLPAPGSIVFHRTKLPNTYGSPEVLELSDAHMVTLGMVPLSVGVDYTFADYNSDGINDVRVLPQVNTEPTLDIYGGEEVGVPQNYYNAPSVEPLPLSETLPAEFSYSSDLLPNLPSLDSTSFVAETQGNLHIENGTAIYSVNMSLPPAVNNLAPALSFEYNSSNSRSGSMGVGWNLKGLSTIARCQPNFSTDASNAQDSNPKYTRSDRLCLNGARLVPFNGVANVSDATYWSTTTYKTEQDSFVKVEAGGVDGGEHAYFIVYHKNGLILYYGAQNEGQNSRIYATGQENQMVSVWALDKVEDRYGNNYTIHYERDTINWEYYPSYISYSPNAKIVFNYIDKAQTTVAGYRPDISWGFDKGYKYTHTKLLDSVTTYIDSGTASSNGTPVKNYKIKYRRSESTHRYLVDEIQECGFDSFNSEVCAKPLSFDWQLGEFGFDQQETVLKHCNGTDLFSNLTLLGRDGAFQDIDGDGYNDFISNKDNIIGWGTAEGCFTTQARVNPKETEQDAFDQTMVINTVNGPVPIAVHVNKVGVPFHIGVYEYFTDINKVTYDKTNGTYSYSQLVAGIEGQSALTVDINNDGLTDFIVKGLTTQGSYLVQKNQENLEFVEVPGAVIDVSHVTIAQFFHDFNSDGLVDSISGGAGFSNPGWIGHQPAVPITGDWKQFRTQLGTSNGCSHYVGYQYNDWWTTGTFMFYGDFNGDGLKDYIYQGDDNNKDKWYPLVANGIAMESDPNLLVNSYVVAAEHRQCQLAWPYDYNRDGREDLLLMKEKPGVSCTGDCDTDSASWHYQVYLASSENGKLNFVETDIDPFHGNADSTIGVNIMWYINHFKGDFDNDGVMDAYVGRRHYKAKTVQPDLMTVVSSGYGKQDRILYAPMSGKVNNSRVLYQSSDKALSGKEAHAPRRTVVEKVEISNGLGGINETYFYYKGAKVHTQGRGDLGFEQIDRVNVQEGIEVSTGYRQDYPYSGRVSWTKTQTVGGQLISYITNEYTTHTQNTGFSYLSRSVKNQYSLTTTDLFQPVSATEVNYEFDNYGSLTKKTTSIYDEDILSPCTTLFNCTPVANGTPLQTVTVENTSIVNDESQWLLGFVATAKTTYSDGAGLETQIVNEAFEQQLDTLDARVTKKYVGTPLEITTTMVRNAQGIITTTSSDGKDFDGTALTTRSQSLSVFEDLMYPTSMTNAEGHVISMGYNKKFGEVNLTTDANNLTTSSEFDVLGRTISATNSLGVNTQTYTLECGIGLSSCPAGAKYAVATEVTHPNAANTLGAPLTIQYFDMLSRKVREEVYTFTGEVTKVDTVYNSLGQTWKESEPYTGVSASYWTSYQYDDMGRAVLVSYPDGSSVVTSYLKEGRNQKIVTTSSIVSPLGYRTQVKTLYINALGQTIQTQDALSIPVDFDYDVQGNLISTIVNNDVATEIAVTYDIAGNKASIDDPSSGVIHSKYNAFKELRKQVWQPSTPQEKSITYNYDKLGRKVSRSDAGAGISPTSYFWAWDTTKKGLLDSKSGNGFIESYNYNSMAQLTSTSTTITGLTGSRTLAYTYDAYGRQKTITYPSGLKVENSYHANGEKIAVYKVVSPSQKELLWKLGDHQTTRGAYKYSIFGNGVVTQTDTDDVDGRLRGITSGYVGSSTLAGMNGTIQNLRYEFDSQGNLMSRASERTSDSGVSLELLEEIMTYDDNNRLTNVESFDFLVPTAQLEMRYSALGNLTYKSDIGTLSYEQVRNASIHAVTSGAGNTYGYDQYGNMTSKNGSAIVYDAFNKPIDINGVQITYGPDHNRFKQINGGKTTFYIAGGMYEEINNNGVTTQKSYVGGFLVQEVQNTVEKLSYLHLDHQGSVEAISDRYGKFVTRLSFDAWGKRREASWLGGNISFATLDSLPTSRGYTGHEHLDSVGLIHMNGRVYDPQVARFLSADILVPAPTESQSYNRYSYVRNNPLSMIDPSGYEDKRLATRPAGPQEETLVQGHRPEPPSSAELFTAALNQAQNDYHGSLTMPSMTLGVFHAEDGSVIKVSTNGLAVNTYANYSVSKKGATLTSFRVGDGGSELDAASENPQADEAIDSADGAAKKLLSSVPGAQESQVTQAEKAYNNFMKYRPDTALSKDRFINLYRSNDEVASAINKFIVGCDDAVLHGINARVSAVTEATWIDAAGKPAFKGKWAEMAAAWIISIAETSYLKSHSFVLFRDDINSQVDALQQRIEQNRSRLDTWGNYEEKLD